MFIKRQKQLDKEFLQLLENICTSRDTSLTNGLNNNKASRDMPLSNYIACYAKSRIHFAV